MNLNNVNRRDAIKALVAMTAAIMAPRSFADDAQLGIKLPLSSAATQPTTQPLLSDRYGELLPQRRLGKTGANVTMLGVGGAHIQAVMDETEAQRTIEAAIAGGIRFFDNAYMYGNGISEERYGKFLTPKYRDVIFLMTKTPCRDAAAAREMLDGSLRRLKTDHLDLWQMHAVDSPADADKRIDNGVLDVLLDAQAKGKTRFIGFTGHRMPEGHLRMLEHSKTKGQQLALDRGDALQTTQMPVNLADPNYSSFILNVMPTLIDRGFGVLAMKTLSNGGFFGGSHHFQHGDNPKICPDRVSIAEAIHFVWSLPVSVLITGAHNAEMLQEKIDLAKSFGGMSVQEQQRLIAKVSDLAGRRVEFYKA